MKEAVVGCGRAADGSDSDRDLGSFQERSDIFGEGPKGVELRILGGSEIDDLIDADFAKHDYDWCQYLNYRMVIPQDQLEAVSLTCPSILNTYSSSFVNGNNSRTSILNTSVASITSSPSTPGNRSTTTRPSLTSRPLPARSQTPAKSRPASTSPGAKTIKSHNSQPSTSTSRSQIPINSNPTVTSSSPCLHSRLSTPTRKPTNSLPAPATGPTTSVGRVWNPAAFATRPCSPSPHARAPVQPIDIPDFASDAPPNLRTRLPERPASAGRVRPGAALTTRANLNLQNVVSEGPDSKP